MCVCVGACFCILILSYVYLFVGKNESKQWEYNNKKKYKTKYCDSFSRCSYCCQHLIYFCVLSLHLAFCQLIFERMIVSLHSIFSFGILTLFSQTISSNFSRLGPFSL